MKHLVRFAALAVLSLAFVLPAPQSADASNPCGECLQECYASGASSHDCINDICCHVCPH